MRIAYFDCFAGASGNMILGALVDAGLSLDALQRELRRLPVIGWAMQARPVTKRGLAAVHLEVRVPGEDHDRHQHIDPHAARSARSHVHHHRTLGDVLAIVREAGLPVVVEKAASAIYHRLGEAEARVHRMPLEEIAFHEVGQIDAIIDIAGATLGMYLLGIERAYCSSLPCGRGFIDASHGRMPSPAPATLELLRGAPTYDVPVDGELVTPTGAAILSTVASFAQRPPMTIDAIGYGAGRSEFEFPNVLRVVIGETTAAPVSDAAEPEPSDVTVLEANIDDMNPQLYEHAIEQLFAAGAVDAWTHPIYMKKGRPGTQLCALAPARRADAVSTAMLAHTTTIGVRRWNAARDVLAREEQTVPTTFGPVRVKVVQSPSGPRARPEYEDCRAIAERDGRALADVLRRVESEVEQWLASRPN